MESRIVVEPLESHLRCCFKIQDNYQMNFKQPSMTKIMVNCETWEGVTTLTKLGQRKSHLINIIGA
jgi:hypothetical protein